MTVGSIVQATGAKPYDATKLDHLGYGASPDVVTSHEFEKMLVDGKIACPSDGQHARSGSSSSSAPARATRTTSPTARPCAAATR